MHCFQYCCSHLTFYTFAGKGLAGLKKLKTLRIDCNQLLKIETPELSQCVQLTSIDISYNMLDSLTVSTLNPFSFSVTSLPKSLNFI